MESKKPIYLNNGIEVLLRPAMGLHRVGISVGLRYGALYERKIGSASLMQDVMYSPRSDIQDVLKSNGIEYDAFVGYDEVINSVSCTPNKVNMALDNLHEIIFRPKFSKKDTETEKMGIILENIKEMETPGDGVLLRLDDIMFDGSRLATQVNGDNISISKLSSRDLEREHNEAYTGKRISVAVYGAINSHDAYDIVKSKFSDVPAGRKCSTAVLSLKNNQPGELIGEAPLVEQTKFAIGLLGPGTGVNRNWKSYYSVCMDCAVDILEKRLFEELRDKKSLVYSTRAEYLSGVGYGKTIIRGGTTRERTNDTKEAIMAELRKMADGEISKYEIARSIGMERFEAQKRRDDAVDSSKSLVEDCIMQLPADFSEAQLSYANLDTIREVAAKYLDPERSYTVMLKPSGRSR